VVGHGQTFLSQNYINQKMKDSKNEKITFKVTSLERKFLEEKAAKNGMNLSEFMRARVIEDYIENHEEIGQKKLTQIELDLIKASLGTYNLVNFFLHKHLSEKELEDINKKTTDLLEKRNYKVS